MEDNDYFEVYEKEKYTTLRWVVGIQPTIAILIAIAGLAIGAELVHGIIREDSYTVLKPLLYIFAVWSLVFFIIVYTYSSADEVKIKIDTADNTRRALNVQLEILKYLKDNVKCEKDVIQVEEEIV